MSDQAEVVRTVWLHLVKEGGRWIPKEVGQALPSLGHVHMSGTLNEMLKTGLVTRFPIPGALERYSYGVTPLNKVPRSVTLADLIGTRAVLETVE